MDKREAIDKVRSYADLLRGHIDFDDVFLFGSYANGTFHKDSDIDVAIVVDHIDGDFFSVNPLLWKLRREIDERIEPIIIERRSDEGEFLTEIIKNGIKII